MGAGGGPGQGATGVRPSADSGGSGQTWSAGGGNQGVGTDTRLRAGQLMLQCFSVGAAVITETHRPLDRAIEAQEAEPPKMQSVCDVVPMSPHWPRNSPVAPGYGQNLTGGVNQGGT